MAKKRKQALQLVKGTDPGLFGQKYSSRDYRFEESWGKNQFNSSFPASLVAYMGSKGLEPVYVCTDRHNATIHKYISSAELLGVDPLSEEAYYDYEADYFPYEQYYTAGKKEKIDLVMINRTTKSPVAGLEVKDWSEIRQVLPYYDAIKKATLSVSSDLAGKQIPLIIQPVWKTGKNMADLDENCLDVFVWSNLSVIQMALREVSSEDDISRNQRTIIWLYKMLWDFTQFGKFNYTDIVNSLSYKYKTDKAFAISGKLTNPFLRCAELTKPRISKFEIKNIILGDGQKLLRPERRFDAYLVSHPELFV